AIRQASRLQAAQASSATWNGNWGAAPAAAADGSPTAAITVAASATPTAAPTWRPALYSEEASPVRTRGTVSNAAAWVGMNVCACPMPITNMIATGTIDG